MSPNEILAALWADGICLKLTPDWKNLEVPAGRLSPGQRNIVLANKRALVALLVAAHTTTLALVTAAMRRCDEFNDDEADRAAMRSQCIELPPNLQLDLLAHFQGKPANL